jgi:rod shape-determining protein MreB
MGAISKLLGLDRRDTVISIGGETVTFGVGVNGVPWKMPAYIAFEKTRKWVLAVGEEAKQMFGREPANIRAVRFTKRGGFGDFDLGEAALRYGLKTMTKGAIVAPRVIIVCPGEQTMMMKTACVHAGAREVISIRPAMAAALGAGLAVDAPEIRAVFVLERDWCAFALISLSGFVAEVELPFGIDALLEQVALHALATRNIVLDLDALHDGLLASGLAGGDLLGWETWLDELETGRVTSAHYSEKELGRGALPFMLRLRWHCRQSLEAVDKSKVRDGSTARLHLFSPYAKLAGVAELIGKAMLREVVVPPEGDTAMVRGGQVFLGNLDQLQRVSAGK